MPFLADGRGRQAVQALLLVSEGHGARPAVRPGLPHVDHGVGQHEYGVHQVGLVVERRPGGVEHLHGVHRVLEHAHAVGARVLHGVVDGGGEQAEGRHGASRVEVLDDARRGGGDRLVVRPDLGDHMVGPVLEHVHLQPHRLLARDGDARAEGALGRAVLVPREGHDHLGVVAAHTHGRALVGHVEPQRHGAGAQREGALYAALEEREQLRLVAVGLQPRVGARAVGARAHLVCDEARPLAAHAAGRAQRQLAALARAPVDAGVTLLVPVRAARVPPVPPLGVRAHVERGGVAPRRDLAQRARGEAELVLCHSYPFLAFLYAPRLDTTSMNA